MHAANAKSGKIEKNINETFMIVQEIIAETLTFDPEEIAPDSTFEDLEVSETQQNAIIKKVMIHPAFTDLELDYDILMDSESVQDILDHIEDELNLGIERAA